MKITGLFKSLDAAITDTKRVYGQINDNFETLKRSLQNKLSFRDNFQCDIITGTFDSGAPRACKLTNLSRAAGAIVVGSSVPCMAAPLVTSSDGYAIVTLFFAGMAHNVTATVILIEEGSAPQNPQTILAGVGRPGIVSPDGTTITATAAGVISSAGTSGPWSLAQKPAVADPRDDEFEGVTPFAGWTDVAGATHVAGAMDPYGAGVATQWRYSWNGLRPSWLLIQGDGVGNRCGIQKPLTLATNDLLYVRFRQDTRITQSVRNYLGFEILLSAPGHYIWFAVKVNFDGLSAGSTTFVYLVDTVSTQVVVSPASGQVAGYHHEPYEYMMIHKVGTTFNFWAAPSNGSWHFLGSGTFGSTISSILINFQHMSTVGPGTAIGGLDFIRFKATATDLP